MTVHRETHTQNITFKRGGRGESVLFLYSVYRRLGVDRDKILEGGTSTYILHLSDLFPMLQSKLEELEASSQQLVAAKSALEVELAAERTATESLRAQAAQEAADLAAKLATLTRQGGLPYFVLAK